MFETEQVDPTDISHTFLYSIADSRTESMKSFVVEEKWGELGLLVKELNLSLDNCKIPLDSDLSHFSSGLEYGETYHFGGYLRFDCPSGHIFVNGNIDLIKIDGKWYVSDWNDINIR